MAESSSGSKVGTPVTSVDIVIPVYNEGENILSTINALAQSVHTPFRILICYDRDNDTTLQAIRGLKPSPCEILPVKNTGKFAHGAVISGFQASTAPAVISYMADDDYNGGIIDRMVKVYEGGCDVVLASRFIPGGNMVGCRWQKAALVRAVAFTMHTFLGLPVHDPTNGFRLFSRRVLETIPVESSLGFTYSIELLVKTHRMGWKMGEVPAQWYERKGGKSRFHVFKWAPAYLKWYFYPLGTNILRRGPETVINSKYKP